MLLLVRRKCCRPRKVSGTWSWHSSNLIQSLLQSWGFSAGHDHIRMQQGPTLYVRYHNNFWDIFAQIGCIRSSFLILESFTTQFKVNSSLGTMLTWSSQGLWTRSIWSTSYREWPTQGYREVVPNAVLAVGFFFGCRIPRCRMILGDLSIDFLLGVKTWCPVFSKSDFFWEVLHLLKTNAKKGQRRQGTWNMPPISQVQALWAIQILKALKALNQPGPCGNLEFVQKSVWETPPALN